MKERVTAMTTNDLTCQELVELVSDYVDETLTTEQRSLFEEHLATCTGCRRYVAQMRQTIVSVGQLRTDDLTPEMRTDLLALFRSWKNDSTVR